MATMATMQELNERNVATILLELGKTLNHTQGEVVVDFSSLRRVDGIVLHALEEFAAKAESSSVRVTLRGVNVDVYKVLALVQLTSRFSFVN